MIHDASKSKPKTAEWLRPVEKINLKCFTAGTVKVAMDPLAFRVKLRDDKVSSRVIL